MSQTNDKVLVAMSGGVDSAVAAALLLDDGYDVTGAFLCLTRDEGREHSRACCSPRDAADARRIADALGIPLITLPVSDSFDPIIDDFAAEYARGRTPNPCVHCNATIKFGRLFDVADAVGARYLASGHYARIVHHDGQPAIARARGRNKDQSYALFAVPRHRLGRILLPIGEMEGKEQVRARARGMGLPVHDKPDSQEVCFVPDGDYASLLRTRAPDALRPGKIVNSTGEVLGAHDGYARFTVGQRRGLKVAAGVPMYVTRIDAATATVTIGPPDELLARGLAAAGANWHCDVPARFDAAIQVRYHHEATEGSVRITSETTFEAGFVSPVPAVTPGQAAVVYDGDRLVGGGWIEGAVQ